MLQPVQRFENTNWHIVLPVRPSPDASVAVSVRNWAFPGTGCTFATIIWLMLT